MDKEYVILNHIHKGEKTTQREIALNAGISVGVVNLLLKKMVRKGLVKIDRINTKTLRYVLTPKGMQEKLQLTYNYAKISYKRISLIREGVKAIIEEQTEKVGPVKEVALFGPDDEIGEIIKMALSSVGVTYKSYKDMLSLEEYIETKHEKWPVLVWTAEGQESVESWHGNVLNVLQRVTY